ncbi:MAG: YccF domain-containing protein [Bacteroidaceae bacterium]|nr:YccF domain-containing protein [Bacteroidaceae bacterium]
MRLLGNLIWFIFGGIFVSMEYLFTSLALMLTIIGIPFGLQTLKLGVLALWPFGKRVIKHPTSGCLNTVMNIVWLIFGGFFICLSHFFWGCIFYITIIGIPFGKQHFKMAHIALTPFGRDIV